MWAEYKFWRNRTKQILDEAKQNFYNNMLKESNQIFKGLFGLSTYSTLLNGAYDKSFKNSLSTHLLFRNICVFLHTNLLTSSHAYWIMITSRVLDHM
jgi:hypothetical protein